MTRARTAPGVARRWSVGAAAVGGTVAVGAAAAWSPWATTGMIAVVFAVTLGVCFAPRLPRLVLAALGMLLLGYAFFGKSFAYLGVAPLYVGELVLALGLLTLLVSGGLYDAFRSWILWLYLAFAIWGAARTIPYIGTYRIDALRDAVVWGYGLFAVFVAAFLPRTGWLGRIPDWYRRVLPWFVLWVPVGWLLDHYFGSVLPIVPGTTDISVLNFKSGDAAVHLAGVAAFVMVGLNQGDPRQQRPRIRASEWMLWALWLVGFLFVAATNRGGALASIAAMLTVTILRPAAARRKIPVLAVLTVALAFGISLANATTWSVMDRDRAVSPQQIAVNLKSIVGGGGGEALEGSRRWRLAWWTRIIDYTLRGDLFWSGKGFGVNLADDDGFQVAADHSLRSPHNVHLMLLARTGVPGVSLWLVLQCAFGLAMLDTYLRARRAQREWWARMSLWVLAYWVAFLVNASFDVFLEGPQGGIWFWSLMGLGLVVIDGSRHRAPAAVLVRDAAWRAPAWRLSSGSASP